MTFGIINKEVDARRKMSRYKTASFTAEAVEASFERFRRVVDIQEPDKVPVTPYLGSGFLSTYFNIPISQWYRNKKAQLKSQLALFSQYPDILAWPGMRPYSGAGFMEVSALGAEIKWSKNAAPQPAKPVIERIEDVKKLEIPSPCTQGYLPMFLKMYRYFKEYAPEEVRISSGYCVGPFDIAVSARGATFLMADLYKSPELVHELLGICSELVIDYMKGVNETIGWLETFTLQEDFSSMLSPKHFEEFVLPYARKLFRALPKGCVGVFFSGGNTTALLDLIPKTEAKAFWFDSSVRIDYVKRKIGRRICLIGNVPTLEVLLKKKPREIEEFCKKLIFVGGQRGGYCLGSGGSIGEGTPLKNIDAMFRAGEKYGFYPMRGSIEGI